MYEIEIYALIAITGIFAVMARQAMNEIMRMLFNYASLFSMLALVFISASVANMYNIPSAVLVAAALLVLVVVFISVLLDVINILKPALLEPLQSRLRKVGGQE